MVLGARSAIFLPFKQLSLIIVDEEHDNSYKQHDKKPYYQAKDVAIMRTRLEGIKVLLGSATPSIESYYMSQKNIYYKVSLNQRYKNLASPKVEFVNMSLKQTQQKMKHNFSALLIEEIQQALINKQQIILFQNRRGYSPFILCRTCGKVENCKNCAVSLTYHSKSKSLKCHYCGYETKVKRQCFSCCSTDIQAIGLGTQRVEETLQLLFPDSAVGRLDYDNTRKQGQYETIISNFENRIFDILVGTQMVSQGLDFENVYLIGILEADALMNFPDFRTQERFFQILNQVSGRAGRSQKQGKVIIQTHYPEHPLFQLVQNNDYEGFYNGELSLRQVFAYPPFTRLIKIRLRSRDEQAAQSGASILAKELLNYFEKRVILGPQAPIVHKVDTYYLQDIIIKIPRGSIANLEKQKGLLFKTVEQVKRRKGLSKVEFSINVDCG